ncbi:MAG: asparagine--tRNA ligase, partial [Planctomycetota bacterium]
MDRMDIRNALTDTPDGREITVAGWVRTLRTSKGGFSFIALSDGSCGRTLQIVADADLDNYDDEIVRLTAGCAVAATGPLVESRGKHQRVEMQARDVRVLGWADPEHYPIQPKRHSFEYLRTQAHLRPRTNSFAAMARIRSALSAAIHEFFQSRGFLWVHTPIITASDCEGAGELFRVTALDADDPPRTDGHVDFTRDFFARRTYLTVSGQLEAEAYACAMGRVYTFGPTFRAENSNTPRHLAEFWMVEPEMAFCDLSETCDLAEAFCREIFSAVLDRCADDLELFDKYVAPGVLQRLRHVAGSGFARITYTDAVDILQSAGRNWQYPPRWGGDLQTEHERYLT